MIILQSANKVIFNPENEDDIFLIGRISKNFKTFQKHTEDEYTINTKEFINVIADIVLDAK